MCIIVDANVMATFLAEPQNEVVVPIRNWLENRGGRVVYSTGGKFSNELSYHQRKILQSFVQAGLANVIDYSNFSDDQRLLESSEFLKSDDPHILALARYTGARVLYTNDHNLQDDFRNKRVIDSPRGKIYKDQRQSKLLTKNSCRRFVN